MRKNYKTIPRSALLVELGKRVENVAATTRRALGADALRRLPKFTEFEKQWFSARQPWRTDCERLLSGVPISLTWRLRRKADDPLDHGGSGAGTRVDPTSLCWSIRAPSNTCAENGIHPETVLQC